MNHFDDLTLATTAHNNEEISTAMLRSFAENIGNAHEILVVDDGSSRPWQPPSIDGDIRLIRNERSLGFCKASDLALREVRTPFALLVDADVLFQAGDFAGAVAEFRRGNWAWVNFRQVSFEGVAQNSFEQPLMPPWIFAAGNQAFAIWEKFHRSRVDVTQSRIVEVDAAHSSCTLVNMEAFHAIGGFDPWYAQCESDIELSLRFRKRGYRVGVDREYEIKHAGAGGRSGGIERVLDLYRARLHLYESEFPLSRFYLRPLLFARHTAELLWFGALRVAGRKDRRLDSRVRMLKGVWRGYR